MCLMKEDDNRQVSSLALNSKYNEDVDDHLLQSLNFIL